MKILVIGDIHIGDSRESTTHPGIVRQANTQSEKTLKALIPKLSNFDFDLVVHTGDALRDTYEKEVDETNLTKTLTLLNELKVPTIHLIGNHELRAFSRSEVENIYRKAKVDPIFYGMQEYSDFRIVWLDIELDRKDKAFLPKNTLEWLDTLPKDNKPSIIFSHYSLIPIDEKGTFYFEKQPETMHLENATDVRTALAHINPLIHINGHVHLLTHQQENKTHYISAPSFSENIAGETHLDNNPGIYSVLEIKDTTFVFSTYSGQFTFAKIQGELEK